MNNAIIGYTGLVGSNLLSQLQASKKEQLDLYNSSNINESANKEYDLVYVSAIQAQKWWANQNPEQDKALIESLLLMLAKIRCRKLILISTVDVYDPPTTGDENTSINDDIHAYGKNRRFAEIEITKLFPNSTIIRLPGLIAPNLKKNILFDLKNKNQIHSINANSVLQWYPLSRLSHDIDIVLKENLSLINLSVEPISTIDIVKYARDISVKQLNHNLPQVSYNIRSIHSNLFGGNNGYCVSKLESLNGIVAYLESNKDEL